VPELFFYDFSTCCSKLRESVFEVWGFPAYRCTYRESVANLALASGLRYTGSMSLSYPQQRIHEIIELKEGYNVKTGKGDLEPLSFGWELRALKEFLKLARRHESQIFFIMVCKLALQMNLQIPYIIIFHIKHKSMNWIGLVSITSLLFTFTLELLDVKRMMVIFLHVRRAVKETVSKFGGSSKALALDDFIIVDEHEDENNEGRIIHSGKDLKAEYYMAVRYFLKLIVITIFSAWLVGHALLKFFCVLRCENGALDFLSHCLPDPKMSLAENETASSLFSL